MVFVARLFCHACQEGQAATGFALVASYQFCAGCAAEFRAAQTWAEAPSTGQFVRDKRFGEAALYTLSDSEA